MKWSEQVATPLCPWCFTGLVVVEVAGHYQCASCKRVVAECCQGEQAGGWLCPACGNPACEGTHMDRVAMLRASIADPRYNVTCAS